VLWQLKHGGVKETEKSVKAPATVSDGVKLQLQLIMGVV
jgi:hypothetical protein